MIKRAHRLLLGMAAGAVVSVAATTGCGNDGSAGDEFSQIQVVSYYGVPGVPTSGVLGELTPEEAAAELEALASRYDSLNGDRDVVTAFHVVVGIADTVPHDDETYLRRVPTELVEPYVRLADARGMLLFLDIQVGWADPVEELRRLEPLLEYPFVHAALDPEFATRELGVPPGSEVGSLSADAVNESQEYLSRLVDRQGLPPKLLVLHQFQSQMLRDTQDYEQYDNVLVTIDMDGFGPPEEKFAGYERYALSPDAELSGFKRFFTHDVPLITPDSLHSLAEPPFLVLHQ